MCYVALGRNRITVQEGPRYVMSAHLALYTRDDSSISIASYPASPQIPVGTYARRHDMEIGHHLFGCMVLDLLPECAPEIMRPVSKSLARNTSHGAVPLQ